MSMATKHKIAPLQRQLIQDPPEFQDSGADRFAVAKAIMLLQHGSVREGGKQLKAFIDDGGPLTFPACIVMAQVLDQLDQPLVTQFRYLQKAKTVYAYDPILYEVAAQIEAKHAAHSDDGAKDSYSEASERWQLLDWSVAASLTPATQLLEWGFYEQAVAFAATGVERWPDDVDLREALVRALVGMDDIEAAREHLIELRQRDPQRAAALVESNPSLGNP